MKKSKTLIFLEVFAIILVLLSTALLVVFIVNFFGMPLSKNMTDWGEFGSYISCIAALVNLVFFVILTYKALDFEKSSYEKQASFQKETFTQQMLSQKAELQTAFRKSHIDDVRNIMFKLNNLTYYDLKEYDEFIKFKRECESLKRIFEIYEINKNIELFGTCNYSKVNQEFDSLFQAINKIKKISGASNNQCEDIWEKLNAVNIAIIALEKQLSDHTIEELTNAFK